MLQHSYFCHFNKSRLVVCLIQFWIRTFWQKLWTFSNIQHCFHPAAEAIYSGFVTSWLWLLQHSFSCLDHFKEKQIAFRRHSFLAHVFLSISRWCAVMTHTIDSHGGNCTFHLRLSINEVRGQGQTQRKKDLQPVIMILEGAAGQVRCPTTYLVISAETFPFYLTPLSKKTL